MNILTILDSSIENMVETQEHFELEADDIRDIVADFLGEFVQNLPEGSMKKEFSRVADALNEDYF